MRFRRAMKQGDMLAVVFPKHQRKGIGSALLKAVLERYENVCQIELATKY